MNSLNLFPLRLSTPSQEGVLRVSKWIKVQLLLESCEMKELFEQLSPFEIYCVSEVVDEKRAKISHQEFLEGYGVYIQTLKEGKVPDERVLKRLLSSVFTLSSDLLYGLEVGSGRWLVKALKPVIQLQLHHFFVSSVDQKFHSMTLGADSISWGVQFSYPQLYQDPKTHAFSKVVSSPDFPNTQLFLRLMQWIRKRTIPTPFIQEGKRVNVPMRLGKSCSSWINQHPQLIEKGLSVLDVGGPHATH
jgi:hypothetical protein